MNIIINGETRQLDSVSTVAELIAQLGLEAAVDITSAAAAALNDAGKIGTVGYCWGGTVALLAALRLGLPSVSYYGARNGPFLSSGGERAESTRCPENRGCGHAASSPPAAMPIPPPDPHVQTQEPDHDRHEPD